MSELSDDRKELLKELIRQLYAGASPQEVKERFKLVLEGVSPIEIAKIEQELIGNGVPKEEVQRLCDIHLAVFREQLEREKVETPPASSSQILMEEHKMLLKLLEKLTALSSEIRRVDDASQIPVKLSELKQISEELKDAEKHYLREENVLFPILEKHGITEPPAMMWMEHNRLREQKGQLYNLLNSYGVMSFQEFKKKLIEIVEILNSALSSHIFKENNILFPTAMRVIEEKEWLEARKEFDEIGYCSFTPEHLIKAEEVSVSEPKVLASLEGRIHFEIGALSKDEIEAILNTLPVDITFVDKDDAVRYFSKPENRIFIRTKAVIDRKVQLCHPQKSIHIVNKILESFKAGERDVAEFWIQKGGRLIHIRYFAVRDRGRKYLGTMEVTQDITEIKKIEGERRLLDLKN